MPISHLGAITDIQILRYGIGRPSTGALEGVTRASVNFATETLTVEYHENATQPSSLAAKVDALGYKAQLQLGERLRLI